MAQVIQSQIEWEEGQIYYEVMGDGMPVVLTHAAFLDSRMFDELVEPLARRFRVIRYDMRGFGRSSPARGPLCRRKDLARLLDHLRIERAHLVGCSNGGQISLDLALEQPERAASLALVGSTPSGFEVSGEPPRYLFEMMEAAQRGDVDRANELQVRIWLDGNQREPNQIDAGLRRKALAMNRIPVAQNTFYLADMQPAEPLDPPAQERLEAVESPVLVAAGALDHPEVLRSAEEMSRRLRKAQLTIFEGCGHVPSFEQPEAFAETLLQFLGQVQ
jgi:pimeloyl-ACP methyl ester carboxylesterase